MATTATLYDYDGKPHKYEVIPHPATEGQEVLWALLAIAAEPGGAALQKLVEAEGMVDRAMVAFRVYMTAAKDDEADGKAGSEEVAEAKKEKDAADADIAEFLRGTNFGSVGADVRKVIMTTPMGNLAQKILAHTLRNGRPLSEQLHFDEAFTANWGEYFRALHLAIKVNRFFVLLDIFDKGGGTESKTESSNS
jgi:hypothetical protein